jgi:adenylate kinase
MELQTVILIGPSGCGKGTQAKLLKEHLEKVDTEHPVSYFQTGEKFREFMEGNSFTQAKVKEQLSAGKLPPGFLPIWIWGSLFIEGMTGNEHLILDGFPRRAEESPILHTAFEFYDRKKLTVIVLDLEDNVIIKRLVEGRKRHDDTPEKVAERLRWFRQNVSLAIKFFEEHSAYNVIHLDGSRSIDDVQADIRRVLEV